MKLAVKDALFLIAAFLETKEHYHIKNAYQL